MPQAKSEWTIVDLPPKRPPAGMFDDLIPQPGKPTAGMFDDLIPNVAAGGKPQAAAKPNFFDQFDEPPQEPVDERGLIEGIISDVRNALGYEQSAKEQAQRALAKQQFDETNGAGGWRDTLMSADGARLVAQGATLGAADEIEAGFRSLGSETYDQALQSVRASVEEARNRPGAFPIEAGAGFLVPGGAAANSLRAAPSIWTATKYGAGLGGAAGFFGSEGSSGADAGVIDHLAERLPSAAFGAGAGGVVGAAFPALGVAGRAATGIAKARLGVGDEAYARQALADALKAEANVTGRTTDDVLRELEDGQLPLALAGNQSLNQLAHRAAESSPVARRQLIDTIADAEGGAGRRVEQAIDDAMGGERAGDTMRAISESRARDAERGYGNLYARNAVTDMSDVVDLNRPTMRAAVAKANRWVAEEGGLSIDPSAVTPKQLDYITRALDDSVDRAFKSGAGQHGAKLAEQRDAFLRKAYEAKPEYRDVRAAYAADSDSLRAIDAGRGARLTDSVDTETFLAQLPDMAPDDRQLSRLGVLQSLRDDVRNAATAPNVLRDVAESPARASNLADILTPLADEAPTLGNQQRRALEALPGVINREARGVRGAQALRQGMPDYEGGLRGVLHGIDPTSVAVQPKATLTRAAARYALDEMNPRRAALVSALLRDSWQNSMPAIRQQLAQRGISIGDWTTRVNAALPAMVANAAAWRPVE